MKKTQNKCDCPSHKHPCVCECHMHDGPHCSECQMGRHTCGTCTIPHPNPSTMKKRTKKVVKAYAVIPKKEWDMGTCLVFVETLCNFTHGVFINEIGANEYCKRVSKGIPSKVVPCVISYEI